MKRITTRESDNSFQAQTEAAIWNKDAAVTVCKGSFQASKQLRTQCADKHSRLMTFTALCAAGSWNNRWGIRLLKCFWLIWVCVCMQVAKINTYLCFWCVYSCTCRLHVSLLFSLCSWAELLARPVILLIALVVRWKGGTVSCWAWGWQRLLNGTVPDFYFTLSLTLVPCVCTLTLPLPLKWIGYSCRSGHRCVQHRIYTELIMRKARNKWEWEIGRWMGRERQMANHPSRTTTHMKQ